MILVDAHCHLFMEPLRSQATTICESAAARGVTRWLVAAYDIESWETLASLVEIPGVAPLVGLHPWVADQLFEATQLARKVETLGAVGIGEIGLDAKIESPNMAIQIAVLRTQLDLAAELQLPVALHCRGAFDTLLNILEEYGPRLTGMIHGFSRGPELARRFLGLGYYLSFGGALTRPRATRARRSAAVVGLDRILLETDSPSLGLEGVAPGESEPKHIVAVAEAMAEIRKTTVAEIARATTSNVERLFGYS